MTFPKTVLAYLTGWLIVQPIYNRLFAAWRRREMARPNGLYAKQVCDEAVAIVDEMEARGHLIRPVRRPITGPLATAHPGWEKGPSGHPQLREEPR